MYIYNIIRYWVCLFVRFRNHLPVVQFQNLAHIRNPHGTTEVFKTISGAEGNSFFLTPSKPADSAAPYGAPEAPQMFFLSYSFTAA